MDLNKIKNIDYKKIINIFKNNYDKDAGLFTLVFFLILFFGIKQFVIPSINSLNENLTKVNQKKNELKEYKIKEQFEASPEAQKTKQNLPIKIYRAPYSDMDIESASVELVQEIINIIKNTGNNRIDKVDFSTAELKDNSGNNSSDFGILNLSLTIEGNFEELQKTLNEIYLMKYLVVIKKIDCTPIDTINYDTLKTDLILDLYVRTKYPYENAPDIPAPGEMQNITQPVSPDASGVPPQDGSQPMPPSPDMQPPGASSPNDTQ